MTAIVDYGVGNLFSLLCSLDAIGEQAVVTPDPDELRRADRVILPGVGAFADAAQSESGSDAEGHRRKQKTADGHLPGYAAAVR